MKYEAPGNLRRALLGLTIVIYERPVPIREACLYEEEACQSYSSEEPRERTAARALSRSAYTLSLIAFPPAIRQR